MSLDQVIALQIDGCNFSLATVLRSAQMQGSFGAIHDYLTIALIAAYAEEHRILASQAEIQEAVTDWRVANSLYQASEVKDWMEERSLSMADLAEFARIEVLKERVRNHVAAGKVERYFAEHRSRFEEVALSQIVVNERGLARELKFKLMEGEEFFLLARTFSTEESSKFGGGYIGRKMRAQLPLAITTQAFRSVPGTIVGPLEIDKKFYVVKIEEVNPAELNADTRARIEQILFEDWLTARRKEANAYMPQLWAQD
ncbi:peptidylprolyl isomerase [Paenibacillus piri]|uniref:peptidylprolyl isomerase n=1 Tax=Paenibacillus piri TaxID=2547395 RepID=A0A4R5KH15_9BACL|nr:peptidylprolyl isomerase [Paenibacillus piri]TDF94701.1 hypothetical protein E1757_22330 [Paenibacillus piri]